MGRRYKKVVTPWCNLCIKESTWTCALHLFVRKVLTMCDSCRSISRPFLRPQCRKAHRDSNPSAHHAFIYDARLRPIELMGMPAVTDTRSPLSGVGFDPTASRFFHSKSKSGLALSCRPYSESISFSRVVASRSATTGSHTSFERPRLTYPERPARQFPSVCLHPGLSQGPRDFHNHPWLGRSPSGKGLRVGRDSNPRMACHAQGRNRTCILDGVYTPRLSRA